MKKRPQDDMYCYVNNQWEKSIKIPKAYSKWSVFQELHEKKLKSLRNILKNVGEYVYNNLQSNKVLIRKPQGGFYLMPEFLDKKYKSSEEMCTDLLNNTGVALLPGSDFGFSKNKMIARLSFTDFNGKEFMENFQSDKNIKVEDIEKFAPKIIEGTKRLKVWAESS